MCVCAVLGVFVTSLNGFTTNIHLCVFTVFGAGVFI